MSSSVVTSVQFVKIHFERIEADSVFVGKTCEECTDELHCLNDEKNNPQNCIHLSHSCLPEGEVSCQVLGGNC